MKKFCRILLTFSLLFVTAYGPLANTLVIENGVKPAVVQQLELVKKGWQKEKKTFPIKIDFQKLLEKKTIQLIPNPIKTNLPNVVIDDVIVFRSEFPSDELLAANTAYSWSKTSRVVPNFISG